MSTKPDAISASNNSYHQQLREEKRSAAMKAAMELFLKQGYERTSLLQIARHAGMSTSTLFKHFPTKTVLFEAMISKYWELDEQYRYLPEPGDPASGLKKIAYDYACLLSRPEMRSLFRVVLAEASRMPELGRMQFNQGQRPFLNSLETYLRSEVKARTLQIPDVKMAAKQFLTMIFGILFWPGLLLTDFQPGSEESAYVVKEAIEMMLSRYAVERRPSRTRLEAPLKASR